MSAGARTITCWTNGALLKIFLRPSHQSLRNSFICGKNHIYQYLQTQAWQHRLLLCWKIIVMLYRCKNNILLSLIELFCNLQKKYWTFINRFIIMNQNFISSEWKLCVNLLTWDIFVCASIGIKMTTMCVFLVHCTKLENRKAGTRYTTVGLHSTSPSAL